MLTTANITMQFGAKPLFENVSVKFGNGNRYGLIGANGSGKSTFMKILGGDLDQSGGTVSLDPGERIGKLRQDQFAYEEYSVIDTVIMGHVELWAVKEERDRIYSLPEMSEEKKNPVKCCLASSARQNRIKRCGVHGGCRTTHASARSIARSIEGLRVPAGGSIEHRCTLGLAARQRRSINTGFEWFSLCCFPITFALLLHYCFFVFDPVGGLGGEVA